VAKLNGMKEKVALAMQKKAADNAAALEALQEQHATATKETKEEHERALEKVLKQQGQWENMARESQVAAAEANEKASYFEAEMERLNAEVEAGAKALHEQVAQAMGDVKAVENDLQAVEEASQSSPAKELDLQRKLAEVEAELESSRDMAAYFESEVDRLTEGEKNAEKADEANSDALRKELEELNRKLEMRCEETARKGSLIEQLRNVVKEGEQNNDELQAEL